MIRSWLSVLFIGLGIYGCSRPAARATEKTAIRMAVGGQTQFIYLPLTLADQLGYFKDEGLSMTISDLRGGSEALAAMMGGSVDMVTGFYEHTIRAGAQGKRLVMVALFDRYPGLVLMVGKQHWSEVHTIKDLVGKPVGVTAPGSSTDQLVKYVLRRNNLDPQSIPVVTAGIATMLAALEQDRVWAGVTVDPLASKLDRDGIARALYDTRTDRGTMDIFGGPWPAGGFYTTAEFVQQRPQTVQSIVNAGQCPNRFGAATAINTSRGCERTPACTLPMALCPKRARQTSLKHCRSSMKKSPGRNWTSKPPTTIPSF